MKRAIYLRLIALTFLAVLICSLISAMLFAVYTQKQTEQWLIRLTTSAAEIYKYDFDVRVLSKSIGNIRVSIISPDGKLLADSEGGTDGKENYAGFEEIKYANSSVVTLAVRTSDALDENFMYAAIKIDDGNILRLAHSYPGTLNNLSVQLPAILFAVFVALILSVTLAGRFTKSVTAPLEKTVDALTVHEFDKLSEYNSPYYEIDRMLKTLKDLLQTITDSNIKLQNEREKAETILSNMAEGFVLVDSQKNILLCNNSARDFFSVGNRLHLDNIYNLTRNQAVGKALQSAIEHRQSTVFDLELKEDLIANVHISPSKTAEEEVGATILIVDRTAEKQIEQQKRDFFSNASHELKTPITSIIGFSEMLSKGMVKNEQEKAEIVSRIETESKRMSELIGDILSISKIEEGDTELEYTDFNFSDVVKDAVNSVSPVKDDTAVQMIMDLDDLDCWADKRQIYELCVNLIENAVKYNKSDGKVHISLKEDGENAVLTVKDTGIGIAPEYHSRVFQRFFRVDYGRDKKIGGVGLGLSIIKHIAGIYGGKISLQSKKNYGTTITVSLPIIKI